MRVLGCKNEMAMQAKDFILVKKITTSTIQKP